MTEDRDDTQSTIEKIIQKFRRNQEEESQEYPGKTSEFPVEDKEIVFRCPHCKAELKWKQNGTLYEIPLVTIPFSSGIRACPRCRKPITRTDHLKQKDFEDFAEGVRIE